MVSPSEPVRLTIVDRGNADLYLTRALSIGEAPKFEAVSRQALMPSDEDLRRGAVVVLNDVNVSAGLARRLASTSSRVAGCSWPRFRARHGRRTWICCRRRLAIPSIARAATPGASARSRVCPVFEPFRAPRSGDFSSVPVYGYRNLTPAKNAQVLARFDAGAPAFGRAAIRQRPRADLGSTLDVTWSDLPQRRCFCHSSIAQCDIWPVTPSRSRG